MNDNIVEYYEGLVLLAPCCSNAISFTSTSLDSVAIRCPSCDAAIASSALVAAVSDHMLRKLGDQSTCRLLADFKLSDCPWCYSECQAEAAVIEEHGLLLCRRAIEPGMAEAVRLEAEVALAAALTRDPDVLTSVRDPLHRHDVQLNLTGSLLRLLRVLLAADAPAGRAVQDLLGLRARLCECSCIISEPGAQAQAVHCDTEEGGEDFLLTAFVALNDIEPSMGPTAMWPQTHTLAFAEQMGERGPLVFKGRPSVAMTMDCGDCALMHSRLWHCGGANTSPAKRRECAASRNHSAGASPCAPPAAHCRARNSRLSAHRLSARLVVCLAHQRLSQRLDLLDAASPGGQMVSGQPARKYLKSRRPLKRLELWPQPCGSSSGKRINPLKTRHASVAPANPTCCLALASTSILVLKRCAAPLCTTYRGRCV